MLNYSEIRENRGDHRPSLPTENSELRGGQFRRLSKALLLATNGAFMQFKFKPLITDLVTGTLLQVKNNSRM